ncbi:MAG: sugar kinase [Gemmataceae bacterium]
MANEVVAFGEAMIRLTPPGRLRVEQTASFDVQVGGAELNTAAGLAQIGRSTAWVSRLTDNSLGRLVAARARASGVVTNRIVWTAEDRVGLFFLEEGSAPRPSQIVYDRAGSAFARLVPGMIPWDEVLAGSRWFHVSGISLAVSDSAAAVTREALAAAKRAGLTVSFDPNYRSKLWPIDVAARVFRECMRSVDVLIASEADAIRLLDIPPGSSAEIAARLCDAYGVTTVAFTRRDGTSVTRDRFSALLFHQGLEYSAREYDIEVVDRIGAGDAFAAGLIDGLLDSDASRAVEQATALAALKHTVPGDSLWITRRELDELLRDGSLRVRR